MDDVVSGPSSASAAHRRRPLVVGADGDLLAARQWAAVLLRGFGRSADVDRARLLLMAVSLEVGRRFTPEPTWGLVEDILAAIARGDRAAWEALEDSPVQFCQFVAREAACASAQIRQRVPALALRAVQESEGETLNFMEGSHK